MLALAISSSAPKPWSMFPFAVRVLDTCRKQCHPCSSIYGSDAIRYLCHGAKYSSAESDDARTKNLEASRLGTNVDSGCFACSPTLGHESSQSPPPPTKKRGANSPHRTTSTLCRTAERYTLSPVCTVLKTATSLARRAYNTAPRLPQS